MHIIGECYHLPKLDREMPLVVLDGTDRGVETWFKDACGQVLNMVSRELYITLPWRIDPGDTFYEYLSPGGERNFFNSGYLWRQHYYTLAGYPERDGGHPKGAIVLWLTENDGDFNEYVDVMKVITEWRTRIALSPRRMLRLYVGSDEKFPWIDEVQYELSSATQGHFPIYNSYINTIGAAIGLSGRI